MFMTGGRGPRLANFAAQLLLGAIGLAVITFLCFRFGAGLASTAFAYMTVLTLLSLIGSFIGAVILSIAAVACLNYFFTPPLFTFRIEYPQDILAVAAFLTLSLLVTTSDRAVAQNSPKMPKHLGDCWIEQEARNRRLVDANIIGIFIWDFDGRILEANDAFLRMLGIRP